MERANFNNYGQTEQTIYPPHPESPANAIGSMVLSFVLFESIFGGMGVLGGNSVLGSSESFAHATAEVAGVNNIASLGYENRVEKA